MAKINNAQIIQKLVDELKLYPGKDLIPSELADKILAVYQVNDQEVSVNVPTANTVATATRTTPGTTAIFTTPATGEFFLTNLVISASVMTIDELIYSASVVVTIDGTAVEIARVNLVVGVGSVVGHANDSIALNLQNPVLIDQATAINLVILGTPSLGIDEADASIVGYTIPA